MRLVLIAILLLLTACAAAPKRTITVTTTDGKSYEADPALPDDPRTYPDGTRMDWVELAVVKVNGALPPPPRRALVWSCWAADLGTTAIGLSMGFAEANPIGLAGAIVIGLVSNLYAKKAEKEGDVLPANISTVSHCGAAAWNLVKII